MKIVWEANALDELADIWSRAASIERRRITSATVEIERRLGGDPTTEGESRPRGRRILFSPPLGVTFRVKEDLDTVFVLRVWHVRHRNK